MGEKSVAYHHHKVALRYPFHEAFEVFRRRPYPFFLDTSRVVGTGPHYSYMGASPSLILRARRGERVRGRPDAAVTTVTTTCVGGAETVTSSGDDPFAVLATLLARRNRPELGSHETPFLSGAVGYVGYEAARFLERLPGRVDASPAFPDIHFAFYDACFSFNHQSGEAIVHARAEASSEEDAQTQARERALELADELVRHVPSVPPDLAPASMSSLRTSLTSGRAYAWSVEQARSAIAAGDAFEVCLTHRIDMVFGGDSWRLYQDLRRRSPAPYASYLELPEGAIVSSSPERFLRLTPGGDVSTRPIKGTRRRDPDPEIDRGLAAELATSEKDRAENVMIVDLMRNDLGRVCEVGSVEAPAVCVVEQYATVWQLVSEVTGRLRSTMGPIDLLCAAFPPGSMTGAPKVAAMKVIDRLETSERGVYSGVLGYIDDRGGMDLSVVIRTLVVHGGIASCGVGGAVVYDSDPASEYDETLAKASALLSAVASVSGD